MRVHDLMTKDVQTVTRQMTLKDFAQILVDRKISGMPVVAEANRVVGVISEADILVKERSRTESERGVLTRLLLFDPLENLKLDARTVGEAMSAPPITISPNQTVRAAAALMLDEGVKRLPVVGDDGGLLGIVTRSDLVRAFVRADAEIEREIREDVIGRTLWISPEGVDIHVEKGEVLLSGTVDSKTDAELIPEFTQRVPGVVSVLSKLRWREEQNGDRKAGRRTLIG